MSSQAIVHEVAWVFKNVYNHRSSWPFVFFLPCLALAVLLGGRASDSRMLRYGRAILIAATVVLLGVNLHSHILYTTSNHFSNVYATDYANEAWTFAQGQDLYSSFQSSFRYNLCYGPGGYLLVAASQQALSPSPFSSRLPIFCCWLGGFILLYLALRKRHEWDLSLMVTTIGVTLLPHMQESEFWPRPDLPQFFFVMAGVWVIARDLRFSWVLLGLLIGIAVSIKINGFAYFLPLIGIELIRRPHLISMGAGFLVSVFVSLLPFLIFHNISLATYTQLIQMTLHHDVDINWTYNIFEMLVVFSFLAFAPLIVFRINRQSILTILKKNCPYLVGLSLGLIIIGSVAIKKGAGDHHLIPFIGPFLYLGASLYADLKARKRPPGEFSPVGASLFFSECGVLYCYSFFFSLSLLSHIYPDDRTVRVHENDLHQIVARYHDNAVLFASGWDDSDEVATYGSYLVFHGMPIGINSATVMDYNEAHIPQSLPDEVANEIADKFHRKVIWITPRGDSPFTEPTFFAPYNGNYSPAFIENFHQRFKLVDQSEYFDIYGDTKP